MKKLYILCIDDQRDVLACVVRDLAPLAEYVIIEECESAEDARQLIAELGSKTDHVGLFICDHIMPGTSGVDFLTSLTKDPRFQHARKILLTGQASHEDTIGAINRASVDYYLEKPWKDTEMLALCRRYLTEFLFDADLYSRKWAFFADPEVQCERLGKGVS